MILRLIFSWPLFLLQNLYSIQPNRKYPVKLIGTKNQSKRYGSAPDNSRQSNYLFMNDIKLLIIRIKG
jgi:hypothetical protein